MGSVITVPLPAMMSPSRCFVSSGWFSHLNPLLSTGSLDWFKQQQLNPQNPFDIIPSGKPHPLTPAMKRIARYTSFTGNISGHCGPPGQEKPLVIGGFEMKTLSPEDLTSLYDKRATPTRYRIWWQARPVLMPFWICWTRPVRVKCTGWRWNQCPISCNCCRRNWGKPHASEILPDLTRREHRIIGIDSHYRIARHPENKNTAP